MFKFLKHEGILSVLIRIASSRRFKQYTENTIFNMNKKNTLNYPKSAAMGFFSKGHKNEFETVVVNEPSVFELLKMYCNNMCSGASSKCLASLILSNCKLF